MKITDEEKTLLKSVIDHFDIEDRPVRERQIRTWRRLKLFWDGFQRIWYSEIAHDWRIFDEQRSSDTDQSFYDKPVNVYRAYLESIIAALSATVPGIKCYPDDADNPLDLSTARAGDKIAQLIFKHNDAPLLWLHALFIYCTEGLIACYSYPKEDDEYGTYEENEYEDETEMHEISSCPICGSVINDTTLLDQQKDEYMPEDDDANIDYVLNQEGEICPTCLAQIHPVVQQKPLIVTRLIGVTTKPKTRQCLEVYGGLYVKVANYAKYQKDTPYLTLSYETHYALARDRYKDIDKEILDKIGPGSGGAYDPYERWGRLNPQYYGEYPLNNVTIRQTWLRPAAFNVLDNDQAKKLLHKFPDGCKVDLVNDMIVETENECLDDCWTLSYNPLSDYLYHDPLGMLLTSIQELTNDVVSLVVQTIEHGIPQTFADPSVLNFDQYRNTEVAPGMIFPASPKSGKAMQEGFYEVKTATLSQEVMPFMQQLQNFGQLVSGALPSLFGGQLSDNKTASGYSMSRTQALQRLQNTWKMLTIWWKQIFGKVIPAYIKDVVEDEKFVERTKDGGFINTFIRKAELEGKIGSVELEASETLPMSQAQIRDAVMNLLQNQNPQLVSMMLTPENLPLIYDAIGLTDFDVPDEDSRNKQYDEINILIQTEPISIPNDPQAVAMSQQMDAEPLPETEDHPSVEVDPIIDKHNIEFEVCRKWLTSDAGRQAKQDNPLGYQNVLLHAKQHYQLMQQAMMAAQGAAPLPSQPENNQAPIQGESDVNMES